MNLIDLLNKMDIEKIFDLYVSKYFDDKSKKIVKKVLLIFVH